MWGGQKVSFHKLTNDKNLAVEFFKLYPTVKGMLLFLLKLKNVAGSIY